MNLLFEFELKFSLCFKKKLKCYIFYWGFSGFLVRVRAGLEKYFAGAGGFGNEPCGYGRVWNEI